MTAAGQESPKIYTDYRELLNDENVNTVIIASSWESHVEVSVAAMKAGKAVAVEVGGAYTIEQCYELVRAYEETGTPFMFLENCCYGRREMMALNMVRKGLFGEIVHCSGGYHHDLRELLAYDKENRSYRLLNYLKRNCENYPTHDLGPIAKVLNINKGNRMVTLTSMASKAAGMHEYLLQNKKDDEELLSKTFIQGDIVTTLIKCANGETIVLTLDTTLPRYYSRGFTVRGTKGMYEEVTDSVFFDTEEDRSHDEDWGESCGGNAKKYAQEYEHPVWEKYLAEGIKGTHGGRPMPIDVYDAASWMSITALSEMSILRGGAVVDIPDFTNGKWHLRTDNKE